MTRTAPSRPASVRARRTLAGAAATTAVACFAAAMPAVASADWQDVPVPDALGGSTIVTDGGGTLFGATVRNRPTSADLPYSGPYTNVRLSQRAPGGAWNSTDLRSGESDPPRDDDGVYQPALTTLGNGLAFASWTSRNTAPGAATIGGTPTAALADVPPVPSPSIVRGPAGTVVAVGKASDGKGWVSSTRSKAGAWSAPTAIAGVTGGSLAQVVVGSTGQIAGIWTVAHPTQPGPYVTDLDVVAVRRTVNGTWQQPRVLAGVLHNIRPAEDPNGIMSETVTAALDGQNRLTAVFATAADTPLFGDQQRDTIRAATQEPGQNWSPATTVAGPTTGSSDYCPDPARRLTDTCPRVADVTVVGTRTGKTVATWWDVMTQTIRAAGTDDAGRWSAPTAIATIGSGFDQPLAAAENPVQGVVTIEWQPQTDRRSPSAPIQARDFYPWDGTISRLYTIPTALTVGKFSNQPLTITDAGDTVLPYSWSSATESRTGVTVDDSSGPSLSKPTGPRARGVGAAGTYAIIAKDTFSDLGTITWDFGDGTSATGARVSHAWKAAGTYPVSITATDSLGNRSATSTVVTVTAAKAATTTMPVAARIGRSVRLRGVRVTDGRLSFSASGPAKLNVAIQHRAGRNATRFVPLTALQMDPGTAGTITARVPGLKRGHSYKVIITRRGTLGRAVTPLTTVVR